MFFEALKKNMTFVFWFHQEVGLEQFSFTFDVKGDSVCKSCEIWCARCQKAPGIIKVDTLRQELGQDEQMKWAFCWLVDTDSFTFCSDFEKKGEKTSWTTPNDKKKAKKKHIIILFFSKSWASVLCAGCFFCFVGGWGSPVINGQPTSNQVH